MSNAGSETKGWRAMLDRASSVTRPTGRPREQALQGVVPVGHYVDALRRGWRVVGVGMVVGALVGALLATALGGDHTAEARVEVRPIRAPGDEPNLDVARLVDAETEAAIAGSLRVAEVAAMLRAEASASGTTEVDSAAVVAAVRAWLADGAPVPAAGADGDAAATENVDGAPAPAAEAIATAQAAVERVDVTVVGDSHVLAVAATDTDPTRAQALAQSTAVAYLEVRRHDAVAASAETRSRLEARQAELVAQLDGVGGAEIAVEEELAAIGAAYANLEALSVDPGAVLTDAPVPTGRNGLPVVAGPVLGALLGLVAGAGAAFVADRTDGRLRDPRAELASIGIPLLATPPVGQLYEPDTVGSEAYRRLQRALLHELDQRSQTVVLVGGVDTAGAASSLVANLGVAAARAGRRTLIVEANLRNGNLDRVLGIGAGKGLTDIIVDDVAPADVVTSIEGVDELAVLQGGTRRERPAEIVQSAALERLLDAAGSEFDLVLVEVPPIVPVADAVEVAGLCDGAVIVADLARDTRRSIEESIDQLRDVGSDVIGVVATGARR